MDNELVINESNFDDYFFDIRLHEPKKGQVIAVYTAIAELLNGIDKQRFISILMTDGAAIAATQFAKKVFLATEEDSVKLPISIIDDLKSGMKLEEVFEKPYKYTFQMSFYTNKEYIPHNDPHWSCANILNGTILS